MKLQSREWKPILGYEDRYLISNDGLVLNNRWNRLKKPQLAHNGYLRIGLSAFGKTKKVAIHRLVAEAFIGPQPTSIHQVHHKDENKTNNHVSNLEWVTPKENMRHYRFRRKM